MGGWEGEWEHEWIGVVVPVVRCECKCVGDGWIDG